MFTPPYVHFEHPLFPILLRLYRMGEILGENTWDVLRCKGFFCILETTIDGNRNRKSYR